MADCRLRCAAHYERGACKCYLKSGSTDVCDSCRYCLGGGTRESTNERDTTLLCDRVDAGPFTADADDLVDIDMRCTIEYSRLQFRALYKSDRPSAAGQVSPAAGASFT